MLLIIDCSGEEWISTLKWKMERSLWERLKAPGPISPVFRGFFFWFQFEITMVKGDFVSTLLQHLYFYNSIHLEWRKTSWKKNGLLISWSGPRKRHWCFALYCILLFPATKALDLVWRKIVIVPVLWREEKRKRKEYIVIHRKRDNTLDILLLKWRREIQRVLRDHGGTLLYLIFINSTRVKRLSISRWCQTQRSYKQGWTRKPAADHVLDWYSEHQVRYSFWIAIRHQMIWGRSGGWIGCILRGTIGQWGTIETARS